MHKQTKIWRNKISCRIHFQKSSYKTPNLSFSHSLSLSLLLLHFYPFFSLQLMLTLRSLSLSLSRFVNIFHMQKMTFSESLSLSRIHSFISSYLSIAVQTREKSCTHCIATKCNKHTDVE